MSDSKEAFEKWFLSLNDSHLNRVIKLNRGASYETWQAACEYKNKEIDFFKDRNKTNISRVTCINQVNDGLHILLKEAEAENKKLREALEFYVSKNDDGYLAKITLKEVEE